MKQCAKCGRSYKDDLNFCLDDGFVLRATHGEEETVVLPQPVSPRPAPPEPAPAPSPSPSPSPVVPIPARPQQRATWIALGVVGFILLVLIFGVIGFALWAANRDDRVNAQATNSPTPSLNISASPNSSPTPLCVVPGNCPTPTPTSTPTPTPTNSPGPSPTSTELFGSIIHVGTYQCELNYPINDGGVQLAGTLKLQFAFDSDWTYTGQGYLSVPSSGVEDRLYMETRGRYSQADGRLQFSERVERVMDVESNSWKPWTTPSDGDRARNRIQNVTPDSFQLDIGPNRSWVTLRKL